MVELTVEHVDAGRRSGDVGAHLVGVGHQVGLGEDDERRRAALPGQCEEALDAAEVRLGVQPLDDDGEVDVGGEHLPVRGAGRDAGPDECGTPGKHRLGGHPAVGPGARGDPVADARGAHRVGSAGRRAAAPEKVSRIGPSAASASQAPRSTRLTRAATCSAA